MNATGSQYDDRLTPEQRECVANGLDMSAVAPDGVRDIPGPYFHRPVCVQMPAGVPLNALLNHAAAAANELSRQGWEVCCPPIVMASGGPLVGSQKVVNVVFWARCPADSPLIQAVVTPPPEMDAPQRMGLAEAVGTSREAVPA